MSKNKNVSEIEEDTINETQPIDKIYPNIIWISELIYIGFNFYRILLIIKERIAENERSHRFRKEQEYQDIQNAPELYDFFAN